VFPLDHLRPGERATVVSIDDPDMSTQAIRLGMSEGSHVTVVTKIPAGPVVIQVGRQEIAVGRGLARKIEVSRVSSTAHGRQRRHGRGRHRHGTH
jgi:Fe2+ transport system protein FeoA